MRRTENRQAVEFVKSVLVREKKVKQMNWFYGQNNFKLKLGKTEEESDIAELKLPSFFQALPYQWATIIWEENEVQQFLDKQETVEETKVTYDAKNKIRKRPEALVSMKKKSSQMNYFRERHATRNTFTTDKKITVVRTNKMEAKTPTPCQRRQRSRVQKERGKTDFNINNGNRKKTRNQWTEGNPRMWDRTVSRKPTGIKHLTDKNISNNEHEKSRNRKNF